MFQLIKEKGRQNDEPRDTSYAAAAAMEKVTQVMLDSIDR